MAIDIWTRILPDDPLPTTAFMVVGDISAKESAGVPPKVTFWMLVKLLPVMVTVESSVALVGVKE